MRRCGEKASRTTARTLAAVLAAALMVATAEAFAQEKQPGQSKATPQAGVQPVRRIVISIPDRKLAVVSGDRVVKIFPVAVGAPVSPSPTGEFKIVHRITRPTYYAPGTVIPPGRGNPLGTRWLGLNQKGYGIHGTNQPRSIGRNASHGCIRLRNREIEELFELVRVGDVVELHAKRSPELAQIFGAPAAPATPASALATATMTAAEQN